MPDNVNWAAIAQGSPVIVLYMALKHLGVIAQELIRGGRNPNDAVALVSKASTAEQRVLETTLATAAHDAEAAKLPAPALVVVGDVVRLRSGLDWLGAIQDGRKLDADPLGELLAQKRA